MTSYGVALTYLHNYSASYDEKIPLIIIFSTRNQLRIRNNTLELAQLPLLYRSRLSETEKKNYRFSRDSEAA